jgi:hypothetical protein
MSTAKAINQEEILQTARQRAFIRALAELQEHKDIDQEESNALMNHETIRPMIMKGIISWCDSKQEAFVVHVIEMKKALEQCRETIQVMKSTLLPDMWTEKNDYQLSEDTSSDLDDIDVELQELLDNCLEIERRGS